jgi:hypothetical protein
MVQRVDKISAHFQLNSFRKAEALGQGQVKDCEARPSQRVPALVTEFEQLRG